MNIDKTRKLEIGLIVIFIVSYCIAIVFDFKLNDSLSPLIMINYNNIEGQMNTIFQVQASIVTLGIALIALLTGTSTEMVFGVPVSRFIMQIKPFIFKHKNSILVELVLMVITYLALTLQLYNILVVNFLFSLVIIGLMICGICVVFNGRKYIEDGIKAYLLNIFESERYSVVDEKNILLSIVEDVHYAVDNNDIPRINKNLEMMANIFDLLIDEKHFIDNKEIISEWEEIYTNLCNTFLKQDNGEMLYLIINSLNNVYEKIIGNKNAIELNVWRNISEEFFIKVNKVNYKDNLIESIMLLHLTLYKSGNLSNLSNYSVRMYYAFCYNNKERERTALKARLFDYLDLIANYMEIPVKNKRLAFVELSNYTKILIDNFEENVLKKKFFVLLEKNSWKENESKYIFKIIIYLYYLAVKENENLTLELKKFANKLLDENKNFISNFIITSSYNSGININKEFIDDIKSQISWWEILPEEEAKWCILENVLDEFFLFYILTKEYEITNLIDALRLVISDVEFSFYNSYVGKQKEQTKENFEKFLALFYSRDNDKEESARSIERLENAIATIYKISELSKIIQTEVDDAAIDKVRINLEKYVSEDIEKNIRIFTKRPTSVLNNKETAFRLETYTKYLNDKETEAIVRRHVAAYFISNVIRLIYSRITFENVLYNDKTMLIKFFELVASANVLVDTLIGYKNMFFRMDREDEFKKFESEMFQIKSDMINNIVVAVDSSELYMDLLNVEVKIEKFSEEEILEKVEMDDNGNYLYNITNDIFLPFKKEELIEYFSYAKRRIIVETTVEYGFVHDNAKIGVGIQINR